MSTFVTAPLYETDLSIDIVARISQTEVATRIPSLQPLIQRGEETIYHFLNKFKFTHFGYLVYHSDCKLVLKTTRLLRPSIELIKKIEIIVIMLC